MGPRTATSPAFADGGGSAPRRARKSRRNRRLRERRRTTRRAGDAAEQAPSVTPDVDATTESEAMVASSEAQLTQLKVHWLSELHHETRTPLNDLLSMAEILLRTELTNQQRLIAERLLESGSRLATVTEDALRLAALVTDDPTPRSTDFTISTTMLDLVRLLRGRAARNRTTLRVDIADDVPKWLYGDVGRIRQVLAQLLSNAVRHTSDGEVVVSVTRESDDGRFRFSVTDTGEGMATDVAHALSSDPMQTDPDAAGDASGLARCRYALAQLDGHLDVVSTPGAGSRFSFAIALHPGSDPRVAGATAPLIMVVDDGEVAVDVAEHQLRHLGYRVCTAASGAEALAMLDCATVDAIFMECMTPDVDGFELTRRIRQRTDPAAHVPIIALTGMAPQEGLERCLRAGMDGYLAKPATQRDLLTALQRHDVAAPAPSDDALVVMIEDG